MPILIIMLLLITAMIFPKLIQYNRSQYKEESGNGFMKTILDQHNYGEFLAFTYLEEYEIYQRLITNRLIKNDRQGLDLELVMINETGLYVFDINNGKGSINGDGAREYWTRSYKNKKQTFKNPLLENKERIQFLKKSLPEMDEGRIKSYVLFNNDCTLDMEQRGFEQGEVLKMMELIKHLNEEILKSEKVFTKTEIDKIYEVLKKASTKK